MPREVPHVLLGRVAVMLLQRHGAHRHVRHLSRGHRELDVREARELLRDLVVRSEGHPTHQVVRGVGALSLLGQARHAPHDGAVLVLVLGLARRHLDQRLLQRVHGAQKPFDALDLTGAPVKGGNRDRVFMSTQRKLEIGRVVLYLCADLTDPYRKCFSTRKR